MKNLESEVTSLRTVDEMRKAELSTLRHEKELFVRREEELRDGQEMVRRLKAELEERNRRLEAKDVQERFVK